MRDISRTFLGVCTHPYTGARVSSTYARTHVPTPRRFLSNPSAAFSMCFLLYVLRRALSNDNETRGFCCCCCCCNFCMHGQKKKKKKKKKKKGEGRLKRLRDRPRSSAKRKPFPHPQSEARSKHFRVNVRLATFPAAVSSRRPPELAARQKKDTL